jgi:hypothetical protein
MLKLGMSAAILYTLHFFLLGAFTGAAMNLIGASRLYVFSKVRPNRQNDWILFSFMILAVVATAFTWQGPISIFAMAGSICGGIAFWHDKPKSIRRWMLVVPPLWFTYAAFVGSYPGMFIEAFIFGSNLVGQYKFDVKKKVHLHKHLSRPV